MFLQRYVFTFLVRDGKPNRALEIVNKVLEVNIDRADGEPYLWLAHPACFPTLWNGATGTVPPVDHEWRSPFLSRSLHECYLYLHTNRFRLPWFIDRYRFVVLDETLKEQGSLQVCRRVDKDTVRYELPDIPVGTHGEPIRVEEAGNFLSYEEANWGRLLGGFRNPESMAAGSGWYEQALAEIGVAGLRIEDTRAVKANKNM